jgi:hypothetical protein
MSTLVIVLIVLVVAITLRMARRSAGTFQTCRPLAALQRRLPPRSQLTIPQPTVQHR